MKDNYFLTVERLGIYSSRRHAKFKLETLFKGIDFKNKNILDIGGGNGLYSFYACNMGANKVVCLEPELYGSSSNMNEKFNRLQNEYGFDNVLLTKENIQAFNATNENFDIVLLHNSVNHLDEEACIKLHHDKESKNIYLAIFSKIFSLSNPGATILICDCSRYNIFPLLGVKNIFDPRIEWEKHQSPKVWVEILEQVGFVNAKLRWTSFKQLGKFGNFLFGNKIFAFFLGSHFCLSMRTPL